ncbi:hypothetical protein [Ornithinimicrobium faecis]|uniref:hypothetical protein n=1 Tax=Ornithinimicrobium faecis TaxID=2934158 RepID=UPI0021176424|nr:hypothetical protein [Ornithinimicrobium sp. HY1745]
MTTIGGSTSMSLHGSEEGFFWITSSKNVGGGDELFEGSLRLDETSCLTFEDPEGASSILVLPAGTVVDEEERTVTVPGRDAANVDGEIALGGAVIFREELTASELPAARCLGDRFLMAGAG